MIIPNEILFQEVEERLARGESVAIPFKGRSMEPYLQGGDTITLAPLGKVRRGDVVLFRHEGDHVLHRVLRIRRGMVTLQGDNSRSREQVPLSHLVGRLQAATPARRDTKRLQLLLAPFYFLALAILMWGYFGGIPIESNFLWGIRIDHLIHASVYVPCSWFVLRRRRLPLALAVGLLTESVQHLLPYRGFDVNDLAANVIGVCLGWVVYKFFSHFLRQVKQK